MGITGLNALHIWMIVARDEKLFEPAGVDLDLVSFNDQGAVVPALLSGSVQFGSSSPEQALAAGQQEPSLRMVVSTETANPYSLMVNPGIDSIEDLKGKTIGVNAQNASADYFAAITMFNDAGMEAGKDYTFTNVGPTTARVAALQAEQVDAVLLFPPDTLKAQENGAHIIAKASDSPSLDGALFGTLVALKSWYSDNKDAAAKFVRGYQDTMDYLYDPANKDTVIKDMANEWKVSTEAATTTYEYFIETLPEESMTGEFDPDSVSQMLENAHKNELESVKSVTEDELSNFYDNSLAEAATKITEGSN